MTSSPLFVDDRTGGDRSVLPIVLVHGAPDRSKNFAAVIAELGDLPIITYDRRGYGKSIEVKPPARDFGDHAQDLIELLDGRRAVVCAQSVGCNVAMTAAARAPHLVAALGVWEPPNAWCDWWPSPSMRQSASRFAAATDTEALGEEFNRNTLGDERWESLPERTRAMLRAEGAAFKVDMAAELSAPYDFADLKCPIVIGVGTETSSGHYAGAYRLAEILAADVYVVRGADHFCPLSNPPAWAEMVRRAYTQGRSAIAAG
ncbi:MAG: alpha/beta fold hydrolase [Acidimicrobiia bacterium]